MAVGRERSADSRCGCEFVVKTLCYGYVAGFRVYVLVMSLNVCVKGRWLEYALNVL